MENEAKEMIKNINNSDMVKTKENFEKLIADKIYSNLEDKKIEISGNIFNKEKVDEE